MSRFHAQDGFLHFVFANRKDCYFLPNFVRLSLEDYIYYHLKKQGYEGVLFIDGLEGAYTLTLRDDASRELYQKYYRKGKGFMGLFGGDKELGDNTVVLPQTEDRAARFAELLRKGRNVALVFRLDSFCELFGGEDRRALESLCTAGHKYLEQNGNILILLAPVTAGGSLKYLTDPKGVFSGNDRTALCPELSQILQQSQSVRLYEQLAQDLQDRCVFLNVFDREQMLLMVRYVCLMERADFQESDADIQDLAAFLQTWYESAALREHTGPILPENDTRNFSQLLKELLSSTTWWRVQRAVAELKSRAQGKSLREYLREEYPAQQVPAILADSLVARKIRQIQIPAGLYGSMPELGRGEIAKFLELERQFQSPRSKPLAPELEKHVLQCLATLENAAQQGDTATFERSVRALSSSASRQFHYDATQQKVWNCQNTVLRLSEDIFRMDGLILEDERKIGELTRSKKKLIRQIQEERGAVPEIGSGRTVSSQEYALSVKMQEAVSLDRQAENLKRSRDMKRDRRVQCMDSLRNLELAAGNLSLGVVQDVDQVLREAVDAMERDAAYHMGQEEKLQSLGKTIGAILQEIPQHTEDDVEARYEKMLSQMDTLEQEDAPLFL